MQDFTSLAGMLRYFGEADEAIFAWHCRLNETEIAAACQEGRAVARQLRSRHNGQTAEQTAVALGCRIVREAWQVAAGRIVFFAECQPHADMSRAILRINTDTTTRLAALPGSEAQEWFSASAITEVIIAHELFHLLVRRPPSMAVELAAHAFARTFTELPFSPLLYETLLLTMKVKP